MSPWPWALQALSEVERELVADWPQFMLQVAPTYDQLMVGARCAIPLDQRHHRIMPQDDLPWQSGEGAKAWMRALLQEHRSPRWQGKPFRRQQQDRAWLTSLAPLWLPREWPAERWWIDLDTAYLQIFQPFSLDCVYRRSSGEVGIGWTPFEDADLTKTNKRVGAALVGHCRRTRSWIMQRGQISSAPQSNFWLQPHLYAMVHDTLHAVALDMIADGAAAVKTDAYCFPTLEQAEHGMVRLLADWRLTSKLTDQSGGVRAYRRLEDLDRVQVEGLRRSRLRALGSTPTLVNSPHTVELPGGPGR